MGMDVMGRKPTSDVGSYFRNNIWWWRPLWDYCCAVAHGLIDEETANGGHFNEGHGLNADAAAALADILFREVQSGRSARYAQLRDERIEGLPQDPCWLCEGTGKRKEPPDIGAGESACNGCSSTGIQNSAETWYSFSVENVLEFSRFCKESGGFEIW